MRPLGCWGRQKSSSEQFLPIIKAGLFLRWLSMPCSQWCLKSLTSEASSIFSAPTFSLQILPLHLTGKKKLWRQRCILLPKASTIMQKKFQGIMLSSLGPPFVYKVSSGMSFIVTESNLLLLSATKGLHSESQLSAWLINTYQLVFLTPTMFFVFFFFSILMDNI